MPKARKGKSRYIWYLLRFAVAGAALYLAFRGEDLGQITEVVLGLNFWTFAAALGLYIIGQLIFAFRWNLLMGVQSVKIGYWPALRLHFLGLFYTHCLPSSVGGDLLRAWYVTKHTDKKVEAALSVFVDRVVGLSGMLIMAFCCYWFIPAEGQGEGFEFSYEIGFLQRLGEFKGILVGIAAVLAAVFVAFILSAKGRSVLRRGAGFVREHGAVVLGKANEAIGIYWGRKSAVVFALLLTFCLQGICVVAVWLIGRGIGVAAPAKYYFVFFPISWLLGALPISVGGAGVMELWLKVMFVQVCAVSSKHALVLALGQRVLWLFGSLPGVVIHLVGAHLPREFSIDYDKPIN